MGIVEILIILSSSKGTSLSLSYKWSLQSLFPTAKAPVRLRVAVASFLEETSTKKSFIKIRFFCVATLAVKDIEPLFSLRYIL